MRIQKKNGMSEYFETDKITTSIVNSAYDVNFLLTRADISIIVRDIEKKLTKLRGHDGQTSTYEVRGVIFHTLIDNGFCEIANSYMDIFVIKRKEP